MEGVRGGDARGDRVIELYLRQLASLLPDTRRARFLREAEEHLRDAAAAYEAKGLDRELAEAAAVEAFGQVETVARAYAAEAAVLSTRRAATVAAPMLLALVFPLYAIPENTLPPAPWAEKPLHLAVQQTLALALYALALVLVGIAAAATFTRYARAAAPLLVAAAVAGAASAVVCAALAVQWDAAAPATPLVRLLALLLPSALIPVVVAGAAASWARRRRPLLAAEG
jgi:hypothetical protein